MCELCLVAEINNLLSSPAAFQASPAGTYGHFRGAHVPANVMKHSSLVVVYHAPKWNVLGLSIESCGKSAQSEEMETWQYDLA